jgi:catechol 2,3-dioxygenase-like lactoylglutathione lyase family enzyme
MLKDSNVIAMVAVDDIAAAKEFYGGKLGLSQTDENAGGVTYSCGTGRLFVYPAPTAGSGQSTSATWEVSDIEAVVAELVGKGVTFEHYDMPGGQREGDIHVMGGMKGAWFKDPDGNTLGLASV